MFVLLGFAFLAGVVTILAPCIWPILPIVLSSSVAGGGDKRPLGITLGVMTSFAFFTLAISSLVRIFQFDPGILRIAAVVVIGILGLTMAVPALSRIFEGLISRLSGLFGQGPAGGSGFVAGFATGASLGLLWSPCAGPILAAIAALAATGSVSFAAVLVTLAYVTGVGIPLFAIAYGGRRVVTRTRALSRHTARIQQIFGVIMLLSAIALFTNYDRVIETRLLGSFPGLSQTLNGFESSGEVSTQLDALRGRKNTEALPVVESSSLFNANTPAPEFAGINRWLNTDGAVSLADLRGKVVLVDFWTYTCINCVRTLPHVTAWYNTYRANGFVVIGVHTPEFQFEHEAKNVVDALHTNDITYPVALDNDFVTWNAYDNRYWPAEYLIDAHGVVRRTHFGEGEYDDMERAIRELLKEAGHEPSGTAAAAPDATPGGAGSPETYLGSDRMEYYAGGGRAGEGKKTFALVQDLQQDSFSFGGTWNVGKEYAVAGTGATLNYHFRAGKVFLVLRPGPNSGVYDVTVLLDGKPVGASVAGADVRDGKLVVDSDRLYNLIDLRGKSGEHTLLLRFGTPGIEAFAFTFG